MVQFAAWLVGVNGPIDVSVGLIAAYKLIYANQIVSADIKYPQYCWS